MEATAPLPTGTVTFLFTDIEGSTKLWEQHPDAMREALARHDALLRATIESHGGHVFKTVGDQFCATFATPAAAVEAAVAAQRALFAESWGAAAVLRVRMALHTGTVQHRDGDYFGPPLNRVARLLDAGHGGQILVSQATADLIRDSLAMATTLRDLGAHRLKDLHQPEHLFQLVHPALPSDFPSLRSLAAFAHNLPVQLTRFIGREREMAEVKRLLAASHLLTLTGSGGCGKTRLALQVAADLLEEYPDGVWLVELAALADPALVVQAVAAALGVREEPGRPQTQTLLDYLRPRHLLLVVDNCEHLLDACASLANSLLRSCPHLRVLASSREGLGVAGEQTQSVPSLSVPDAQHLPSPERLLEFEAVQLFAARAALSQPAFAVTAANAPAVVQICRRLDGIPLAIELAAARVKALPVEQLAARMSDFFRLLTGGSRTALPRQQTLRATIDWSYDLLSEPERALLQRLSVFAGGWTLEASEIVCAGEEIDVPDVMELLSRLVEKSLVLYEEDAAVRPRYRLLETVRQYARDRLLERGGGDAVRDRHLDFFLRLAEEAEPQLHGRAQLAWLSRLEAEHNNLRAALEWSRAEARRVELALRLAGALSWFWNMRGYLNEGRRWLEDLLERPVPTGATRARARALDGAGLMAFYLGDFNAAPARFAESVALWRELGDQRALAHAISWLGGCSEHSRRIPLLEEGVALAREVGDPWVLGLALWHFAINVNRFQSDPKRARMLAEESAALLREVGDLWSLSRPLGTLAFVALQQGDHAAAVVFFEEALAATRAVGDRWGIGMNLSFMAGIAFDQGDDERAYRLWQESAGLLREAGAGEWAAGALLSLGRTALRQGQYAEARSHLEEALKLAREAGSDWMDAHALRLLGDVAEREGQGR